MKWNLPLVTFNKRRDKLLDECVWCYLIILISAICNVLKSGLNKYCSERGTYAVALGPSL